MSPEDGQEQWQLPVFNSVKINTDAALFKDPCRYNHAFIARDHTGTLVKAFSKCSLGKVSPDFAESIGIREALSWIMKEGLHNAVLETDCLLVVQLIRSSFSSLSYLGRVVQECRDLLASLKSQNLVLRFVKRSANSVSHYLARYSSSLADRNWGIGEIHPEFYFVLCKDLI